MTKRLIDRLGVLNLLRGKHITYEFFHNDESNNNYLVFHYNEIFSRNYDIINEICFHKYETSSFHFEIFSRIIETINS